MIKRSVRLRTVEPQSGRLMAVGIIVSGDETGNYLHLYTKRIDRRAVI
jgi:hypothetical protein